VTLLLEHLWIIPALPLAGAALNGIFGRGWPKRVVTGVAVGSTGLAFLAALELWREFSALAAPAPHVVRYFPWIVAGEFRSDFALHVDALTMVMVLVVTGVGWLIHIYSVGYMAHDDGYARFFSYLNLFMFFMLLLVMAANYLLLFVGWEGVGLSSYLLIGFWFRKKSAADAGKKAFIVNRIGDFGFLLGILLIFWTFGSLDFTAVFGAIAAPGHGIAAGAFTAMALLLFTGAVGKSAQIPLYVWLPDAMEGPTPVSALIHAATMVTAGVYVVARSAAIFANAPAAMTTVAVIGIATATFAATIALAQTDIKRVLAYSTVSQLGYMFLACGVGAFAAGIFHLFTHAFFKALLFLGAGSVIHAMAGEQDMRRMGGLRQSIPVTYWTMLAGTLAIAGAPLFSGFFSKDAILWNAWAGPYGHRLFWALGLFTAVLTAGYMFRMLFLTFHGAPRFDAHAVHVHESPRVMTGPLVVLAVLSVVGGWVGIPHVLGGGEHFFRYLAGVFDPVRWFPADPAAAAAWQVHADATLELLQMAGAILGAGIGVLVAWRRVLKGRKSPFAETALYRGFHRLIENKYYVDEIYDAVIVRPLVWFSTRVLWQAVDAAGIDGAVNGVAGVARRAGDRLRRLQSGNTRSYATWVVVGAAAFTALLIWLATRAAE
jgi:NADH-quinone oxidoreductase subunit L